MTLFKTIYQSPLGPISLIADESALIGAWFLNQKYFEAGIKQVPLEEVNAPLAAACQWLDAYFNQEKPAVADFIALNGTDFRQRVWTYLQTIPHGETRTYGQIAKALNCQSAQAVGGAVGHNPLSIFVPCHRVLGSQGQLTGYAGGLDKKIWLLEKEKG